VRLTEHEVPATGLLAAGTARQAEKPTATEARRQNVGRTDGFMRVFYMRARDGRQDSGQAVSGNAPACVAGMALL